MGCREEPEGGMTAGDVWLTAANLCSIQFRARFLAYFDAAAAVATYFGLCFKCNYCYDYCVNANNSHQQQQQQQQQRHPLQNNWLTQCS